jgi:hypothetical protein
VADTARGGRSQDATAGRRAGAKARRAPHATEGRCSGKTAQGQRQRQEQRQQTARVPARSWIPDSALGPRSRARPRTRTPRRTTARLAGKRAQGRCCRTRFSETRVAEPVVAEEEATCRRQKRKRRNDWHRSRGPRGAPLTVAPPLVLRRVRESRAPVSTRHRATAGVQYTVLCRQLSSFDEHNTVWGSPGSGVSEKCFTGSEQAVETTGGGWNRTSTTNTPRHRRAASRSEGATSAARDGRPMLRRTEATDPGQLPV